MEQRALNFSLNIKGRLFEWSRPVVMGIVNLTADSFYASSRVSVTSLLSRAGAMLSAGCDIIDLGACSTRPGANPVQPEEEMWRLTSAVSTLRGRFGMANDGGPVISVDTYHAHVAEAAIEAGADIINDVSGGDLDPDMFSTVARLKVPYVLTHMRGTPETMELMTEYDDVVADVLKDLAFKVDSLHQAGVSDIMVDPGFGFAKSLDQNYQLLASLAVFRELGCPLLAGLSRKSMICGELGINPFEALNGTTALNMVALMNGADILRVHDVSPAVETVKLYMALHRNEPSRHRIITVKENTSK